MSEPVCRDFGAVYVHNGDRGGTEWPRHGDAAAGICPGFCRQYVGARQPKRVMGTKNECPNEVKTF